MNKLAVFNFDYITKLESLHFGQTELKIESIENIDKAIDALFTYLSEQGEPELLEELCPYFGVVWPAAIGLTRFLADLPTSFFIGKKILEVGCGLALPSLYLAKNQFSITSSDLHPEVPKFLEKNKIHNSLNSINLVVHNWKNRVLDEAPFDLIIGSDILYENHHPGTLSAALDSHLSQNGEIIIADPGRPYLQPFATEMKSIGFDLETKTQDEIFILTFKRTKNA